MENEKSSDRGKSFDNFIKQLDMEMPLYGDSGIGMSGFGLCENIYVICIFGFIFFAMLPFANSCPDYLVRTNIADELQGRAWS